MYAKPVLVALCACLAMPTAAGARQGQDQLTVVAPDKDAVSYQKWTDRTVARLSRSIQHATSLYRDNSSTGYARVQFQLNDQGKPQNVALAGSSTSGSIDRISLRAIRSMGSLYPLPQDIRSGSRFEAWVIVANDAAERESMLTSLRAEHRAETMAQATGDRAILIAQR
jgi:TonB family protein